MPRITAKACSTLAACWLTAFGLAFSAGDSQAASPPVVNEVATRQLFQAVYANDLAAARASVGNGADVDTRDRWGMTPADIAIDRGNYGIAHFLVSIRNFRREQEARASALASPQPAATPAAAKPTAAKRPATPPAPAPTTAKSDSVTTAPATPVAAPVPASFSGPNPFDPSTPAPGSQLYSSAADAR